MKTSELIGPALDWAVAKCEESNNVPIGHPAHYSPSTNWAQGGPIIDRERMHLQPALGGIWQAELVFAKQSFGPTPLIATMRCFVASRIGGEVEIPKGLLK